MRSRNIKLGRLKGISIQVDPTWFIVFVLITFSLTRQFQADYPQWSTLLLWTAGIIASGLFFASVIIHEMAHSLVALMKGIPVRSITLFIFGGVARIDREANRPGTEFLVAVAGPAASLLLSALFGAVWMLADPGHEAVRSLAGLLAGGNLMLALFNLIPGFPLDGGRILRSIIWGISGNYNTATRAAAILGKVVAYLFIIAGLTFALLGNLVNGLWIGFIGWFLLSAAQQGYAQAMLRNSLAGIKAQELMTRNCSRIPPDISLARFVDDYLFHFGGPCFLVIDNDQFKGLLTLNEINAVPRSQWEQVLVGQAMLPLEQLRWVTPGQDVMKILEYMDRENLNQVPVIEKGQLVGIIGRPEIVHLLQSRLQSN